MKHIKKPDDLNSDTNSLLFRNLLRSSQLKIASGQNIAKLAIVQRKEKPGGRTDVRNSTLVA